MLTTTQMASATRVMQDAERLIKHLTGADIELRLFPKGLKDLTHNEKISALLEIVASDYGVSVEVIKGKTRVGPINEARQMFWYIAINDFLMPAGRVAKIVNRHRTSASHGAGVIADLLSVSHELKGVHHQLLAIANKELYK